MDLSKFPRRKYSFGPTPLEKLDRLSAALDGPEIYMKRDDLLGPAGGGNKTRKLEFLMAEALSLGADTIITAGAIQSNHCRLTLAVANKEGLNCQLVLHEPVPGSYDKNAGGNNFYYHLLGVEQIHLAAEGEDIMEKMNLVADSLREQGRKPYIIPIGGSNLVGSLGYVACAREILYQSFEMGVAFDAIVATSGSMGTYAGLLVGIAAMNAEIPMIGISVSRDKEQMEQRAFELSCELSEKLGIKSAPDREEVIVFDDYLGEGYSRPTPEMVEAVLLTAKTESIILDPVYTGKTMAGLIGLIRKGYFKKGEKVLFLHTGGSPALSVYQSSFEF